MPPHGQGSRLREGVGRERILANSDCSETIEWSVPRSITLESQRPLPGAVTRPASRRHRGEWHGSPEVHRTHSYNNLRDRRRLFRAVEMRFAADPAAAAAPLRLYTELLDPREHPDYGAFFRFVRLVGKRSGIARVSYLFVVSACRDERIVNLSRGD